MKIIDKISDLFKPKFFEFIVDEPIEKIQQKLDTNFKKNLWKYFTDGQNISGKFTNDLKTDFKILFSNGIYVKGGSTSDYGKLEQITSNSTKVIFADKFYLSFTVIAIFVLCIIIPMIILYWIVLSFLINQAFFSIEHFGILLIILGLLFIFGKLFNTNFYNNRLKAKFHFFLNQ